MARRRLLFAAVVLALGCGRCRLSLPMFEPPDAGPVVAVAVTPPVVVVAPLEDAGVDPDAGEALEELFTEPEEDAGPRASWRGRLLGPDGAPLTGVAAQVELRALSRAEVEDGGFTLEGIRPGRYRVAVGLFDSGEYGEYRKTEWGDRVVFFEASFAPGEARVEDLRLPGGGSVTGVMQRPDGGAFGNWWVKLSPPGADYERGIEGGSLRAQTDAHGHFEFHHVPPGDWRLIHGGPGQHRSVEFTRLPVQVGDRGVVFRVVAE